MMNVTAVAPTSAGYVVVYPSGEAVPSTSSLNFSAGQTVPNAVAMRIGSDRKIRFFSPEATTHLIVDVTGWYRPGYPFGSQSSMSTPMLESTSNQSSAAPPQQPNVADWLSTDRPRYSAGDHHAA
jgi:hypothetical protein